MSRAHHLLLTALVILGLLLAPFLVASPGTPAQATALVPAGETVAGQHAPLAKKKHTKKHRKQKKQKKKNKKQKRKARKQKQRQQKRKRDRKRNQRQHTAQPVQLDTGVLPAADETDPFLPDGTPNAQDRYIVRLQAAGASPQQTASAMARDLPGVTPTHVYDAVFDGFAAVIPPDHLDAVRSDPRVAAVEPDRLVFTAEQTLPTGVDRIDADLNPVAAIDGVDEPVDVDVAVIDTAGKITHEDLTIHAWANCTPSHEHGDDHGHGTYVSGIIGAKDNGIGVVGVAPGARLWTIRSLISTGAGGAVGLQSWVICGIDLVTRYATPQADGLGDIEVANFSITRQFSDTSVCGDRTSPYHEAYCRMVAAGVTAVVAAGNAGKNASGYVPASYDEVITVSALADSNGVGGEPGPPTDRGPDESLATFSNFGADVDIAAPGVDILSTAPIGSCALCGPSGYVVASGTSASSPHVAGAAALYLAQHPGASPAEVKPALLAVREQVALINDTDGFDEGILNVENLNS